MEKLAPGLEFVEWPESHARAGTPGRKRRTARVSKELHIFAPQKRAGTSLRPQLLKVLVKQSRDRICHWTSNTAVGSKPDTFKMDPHLTLRFPPYLRKDLPNFGQTCDQGLNP